MIRTTDRLNEADAVVVRIPVVVSAPTLSGIRLDASGVKTELAFGEEPDLSGLAVYAVYTDGSESRFPRPSIPSTGAVSRRIRRVNTYLL